MTTEMRLEHAKWILERNLHWISAAEVKVGVVIAVDTAMLGALAAAFSLSDFSKQSSWANLWSAIAAVTLIAAFICSAMAIKPNTKGPDTSYLFFGKIAKVSGAHYATEFKMASEDAFLSDLIDQIHRNAEIASEKFAWVRHAISWSFISLPIWALAVACLLRAG